jgi:hypothetical protein
MADPTRYDWDALADALAGDQYGWLVAVLDAPAPVECPQCGGEMFPQFGSVICQHPPCHGEADKP